MIRKGLILVVLTFVPLCLVSADKAQDPVIYGELAATVSHQSVGLEGNLSKAYQYEELPEGYYLGSLFFRALDAKGNHLFDVSASGIDQPMQKRVIDWSNVLPDVSMIYQFDRSRFFAEPTTDMANDSQRTNNVLQMRWFQASDKPSLNLKMTDQRVEETGIARLAGSGDSIDYEAKDTTITALFPFAASSLEARLIHSTYQDDLQGSQPDSSVNQLNLQYMLDRGKGRDLTAEYSRAIISQENQKNSSVTEYSLNLYREYTRPMTTELEYARRSVDQPGTINNYANYSRTLQAKFAYLFGNRTRLQAGFQNQNVERLTGISGLTIRPSWEVGWAKLKSSLTRNVDFTAKYQNRKLLRAPIEDGTTSTLLYNSESNLSFGLNAALGAVSTLYGNYQKQTKKNSSNNLKQEVTNTNVGLVSQLSNKLSLNADYLRQIMSSDSPDLTITSLDLNNGRPLLTNGKTFTTALDYRLRGQRSLTANYTRYDSEGGAQSTDKQYGLRLNGLAWKGWEGSLEWLRQTYRDVVTPGLNFSEKIWRVEVKTKF